MATVLTISAHPDDELFGAGYLAKLVAEGHDLYLLCTTRGEGGEVGEPPVEVRFAFMKRDDGWCVDGRKTLR